MTPIEKRNMMANAWGRAEDARAALRDMDQLHADIECKLSRARETVARAERAYSELERLAS